MTNQRTFVRSELPAWLPLALVSLAFLPSRLLATGMEDPLRWIEQTKKPQVLLAPEFYFEFEMKRLAAELLPGLKAVAPSPPEKVSEGGPDYAAETTDADKSDFAAALQAKVIQPPDAAKATAAHEAMRELLGGIIHETNFGEEESQPETKPAQAETPAPESLPEEFPSEFADYHRGALAYRLGRMEEAIERWQALLKRPAAERKYRTVWAHYMIGKASLELKKWDQAVAAFARTREAAAQKFVDTLGLAASSFGWEAFAHEESGRFADAAKYYLNQLAAGDSSAVISLRDVMRKMFGEGADMKAFARDPILHRLATAGALCGMSPFYQYYNEDTPDDLATQWLAALEAVDAKQVRDAERVAWLAYSRGQYARAVRWLKRADASLPYSQWLRAKLALREGRMDEALKLLTSVMEKIPPTPELESRQLISMNEFPPEVYARADVGAIRLGSGEFMSALRLFMDAGRIDDAEYIADGILTIDELKKYLEEELPTWEKKVRVPEKTATKEKSEPEPAEERELPDPPPGTLKVGWQAVYTDPASNFRRILASRLFRVGRYAESRAYLEEPGQVNLDRYLAALEKANMKGISKDEKANALWEAATIMREGGSYLAEFDDPITMAERLSGRKVDTGEIPVIALKYGPPEKFVPPISKIERERLKNNAGPAIKLYYYIYLAADLGWKAAELLPDNSEKTARVLNTAGSWLKGKDDDAADRFYQAIERRCPKTALGKAAIKRHWFVPLDEVPE